MPIQTLEYGGPIVIVPFPGRYWVGIVIASLAPIVAFYFWGNAAIDQLYADGYRYGMHLPPAMQQYEWECLQRPALVATVPLLLMAAWVMFQVLRGRWPSQWLIALVVPGLAMLALFVLVLEIGERAFD